MQRSYLWVLAFCLATTFAYSQAIQSKKTTIRELSFRLQEMDKEKTVALQEKEELHLRIASQDDPAWVEMVLMRDLGVVPEGWLKVHFQK